MRHFHAFWTFIASGHNRYLGVQRDRRRTALEPGILLTRAGGEHQQQFAIPKKLDR